MIKKSLQVALVLGISFLLFLALFDRFIPQLNAQLKKQDFLAKQVQTFHYVALGDSLTEGVGDQTGQGGFVPILANDLANRYGFQVEAENFGLAGNTSKQILARMQEDQSLSQSLKEANLMTLTVGGNDVLAVIRKNLSNLTIEDFEKASLTYQERLNQIITLARADNPNLPIYVLGVYNPFYLSFPDLTEMQEVIDLWNTTTQTTVDTLDGVYFVPINDLIYQGLDEETADQERTDGVNNLLFDGDHFHPNTIGYRLMANAVEEVIHATQAKWSQD